jgi:hypothetical protein
LTLPTELASVRLAWSEGGDRRWLFGLRGAVLVAGQLDVGAPVELEELAATSARLEAALSLGATAEGRERFALLLGPEARLAVVELDVAAGHRGEQLGAYAELSLPGRAFERDQYFGRDLLVEGGAVLVATSEAVHTIEVVEAAGSLTLVPRAGSEAHASNRRGPMVLVGSSYEPE